LVEKIGVKNDEVENPVSNKVKLPFPANDPSVE
jgi:hypothetical protein